MGDLAGELKEAASEALQVQNASRPITLTLSRDGGQHGDDERDMTVGRGMQATSNLKV
jgi:hypothetical protein